SAHKNCDEFRIRAGSLRPADGSVEASERRIGPRRKFRGIAGLAFHHQGAKMSTLVVPGVSVQAQFDPLPPLPAPSGILGAVGIVDRPPANGGLVSVSKVSELRDLLGPGTQSSMAEVVHALSNGVSEAVISPVAGGGPASLKLLNADSNPCVTLRCRSNGAWGNALRAEVRALT